MIRSAGQSEKISPDGEKSNVLLFKTMQALGKTRLYRFGDFRLIPTHRLLLDAAGNPVTLTPKTFDLLLVLVESGGRVLTKDELMSAVWHDTFVEEANLAQTISMLRRALGEVRGQNRFILTVSGHGYRFLTDVAEVYEDEVKNEPLTLVQAEALTVNPEAAIAEERKGETPANYRKWLAPLVIGFGVLLVAGLAYALFIRHQPPPNDVRAVRSIAVLPFKNIGGKADEEYLGQGLAEVLISKLSNIKTIVVRPSSAVLKYGDASPDPKKIGGELGVEAVLMGQVQKVDEHVRVTVQLVRVVDGATLWAGTFDDKFTNIFGVQDSISEQVVASLAVTLTTGERQQLTKRITNDTEAFQLYLQGRYFWNKRTAEGIQKAIEFFTKATAKDPDFARAYSGLADSYMLLGIDDYASMNQREAIARAKAAANKAIAIDDSLAEAHTSLGFMAYNYDFDWDNAESQFRRAIELNPNYVTAHHWYSEFLNVRKRFDESEVEIKKALQLDPSSLIINCDYGGMFYFSRRYEQAVAQYQKTLDLEPRFALAHLELGRVYSAQQRYEEAISEANQAIEISGRRPYMLALLAYDYGMSGRKAEAEALLHELESLSKRQIVLPHNFVRVYIGLHDKKKAMEWMETNFKEHASALIVLGMEPAYDFLRDEPRFQEMLKELKLN